MSPNLSTSHFSGNRRLYEHVVFNTLRVARIASMVENHFHETYVELMNIFSRAILQTKNRKDTGLYMSDFFFFFFFFFHN